jgi:hypothetical protein
MISSSALVKGLYFITVESNILHTVSVGQDNKNGFLPFIQKESEGQIVGTYCTRVLVILNLTRLE